MSFARKWRNKRNRNHLPVDNNSSSSTEPIVEKVLISKDKSRLPVVACPRARAKQKERLQVAVIPVANRKGSKKNKPLQLNQKVEQANSKLKGRERLRQRQKIPLFAQVSSL